MIIFSIVSYRFPFLDIYLKNLNKTYNGVLMLQVLKMMVHILEKDDMKVKEIVANRKQRRLIFPFCKIKYQPAKPSFLPKVFLAISQLPIISIITTLLKFILVPKIDHCPHDLHFTSPLFYLDLSTILSSIFVIYIIFLFHSTFETDLTLVLSKSTLCALVLVRILILIKSN
ncbi:hypothetical protein K502DRAFT_100799 [Neoconidiobolus thromboides FSU 785]|nr:hypothetical protein K502DRAFT_100799 [Neoconidiobolus thromboides FSU 785]